MNCEHLFCQAKATNRLTVPCHKPRMLMCEEHVESMLAWARKSKPMIGEIIVEASE